MYYILVLVKLKVPARFSCWPQSSLVQGGTAQEETDGQHWKPAVREIDSVSGVFC